MSCSRSRKNSTSNFPMKCSRNPPSNPYTTSPTSSKASSRRLCNESPWRRDDYGECTITFPSAVDGHGVRVVCDVADVEDVHNSLAAFGDRYLRKVFTTNEINDCQGRNRVQRLAV